MDPSKVVKTSHFSFENIPLTTDISKPKAPPKLSTLNPLPSTSFEKPKLITALNQNKHQISVIQERVQPWKKSPAFSGLSNERKALHPNLKCQTRKLSTKVAPSSPLTAKDLNTPYSSQLQSRQPEPLDLKSKVFRVRTGSSLAKIHTDSNSGRPNSRCSREGGLRDIPTYSADSDFNIEKIKNSDLARININSIANHRQGLPLLIIHFEGIIGSCLVKAREEYKEGNASGNKEESEPFQYLIRKGVKNELKALAKNFIIIMVLPSFEKKYKKVAKYFINNKFSVDGIYYNTKQIKPHALLHIEDFTLNYNLLLEDFKAKTTDRKMLFLIPLNLSPKLAKKVFLGDNPNKNPLGSAKMRSYEEKQFLFFFPKLKTALDNLKIICIPNFTLIEKNEKSANLIKSSFVEVSKAAKIVLEEFTTSCTYLTPQKEEKNQVPLPLSAISLHQVDSKNNKDSSVIEGSKDVGRNTPVSFEDQENKTIMKTNIDIHNINLEGLIVKLEEVLIKSKKWKKIKDLKQKNKINLEREGLTEFNLAAMKQKIIDHLIEGQKIRGYVKGSVMSHFLVGDLFSRNNYLFKFYEKDDFYTKKIQDLIIEMSEILKNNMGEIESYRESRPKEAYSLNFGYENFFTSPNEQKKEIEDETDTINLLRIKRLTKIMKLYLGE